MATFTLNLNNCTVTGKLKNKEKKGKKTEKIGFGCLKLICTVQKLQTLAERVI